MFLPHDQGIDSIFQRASRAVTQPRAALRWWWPWMSNADSRREKLDGSWSKKWRHQGNFWWFDGISSSWSKPDFCQADGNFWKFCFFLWKGSDFELLADNKKTKTAIFDDIFETIDGWWFCECFVASAEASHSFGFRPSVPLSEESLRGGCFHPGGEISQDMIGLWGSRLETHLSLVVWNICFSIIYGIILPIDFHIFQDGYCTSNQIKFQQSLFVV